MSVRGPQSLNGMRCVVLGAGLGGLSAAVALAARGARVRVLEKEAAPGGRLQRVSLGEYLFDTGEPYLLLPQLLGQLFALTGQRLAEFLEIEPLPVASRVQLPNGAVVPLPRDPLALSAEFQSLARADAARIPLFFERAERMQRAADLDPRVLAAPQTGLRKASTRPLPKALIPATYDGLLKRVFRDPQVRAALGVYAHRLGLGPALMPPKPVLQTALPVGRGAWMPEGGMNEVARAILRLAVESGVQIACGCAAERIDLENGRVSAVAGSGFKPLRADLVVSTLDPVQTLNQLLPKVRVCKAELNHRQGRALGRSGLLWLIGANRTWEGTQIPELVIQGANLEEADRQLDQWRLPPAEPPLFVTFGRPGDAPEGKTAIQVFVPMPSVETSRFRWNEERVAELREPLLKRLEAAGLEGLGEVIETERMISPGDFAADPWRPGGSLFGREALRHRLLSHHEVPVTSAFHGLAFAGTWGSCGPTLPFLLARALRLPEEAGLL